GQGCADRPASQATRPGPRNFQRDAYDLVSFVQHLLPKRYPRIVIGHSMGGAVALLCLHDWPQVFDLAVLSAPLFAIATRWVPEKYVRWAVKTAVAYGLAHQFLPGGRRWHPSPEASIRPSPMSSDPRRRQIQDAWFEVRPCLQVDSPTFGWLDSVLSLTSRF